MSRRAASNVGALDQTDLLMLDVMLSNGRVSIADLATRVNVSRANAYSRVSRMRSEGVIRGFTVDIDPASVGLNIALIVLLRLENTSTGLENVSAALRSMAEVEVVALITGEYDVLVLARVADMDDLRRFVVETLQSIPDVRSTVTTLILEEHRKSPRFSAGQ